MKIRYKTITLSRFEKTKLIADCKALHPFIRVCNCDKEYRPGKVNCCKGEKCVRTMLAFLALGKLDQIPAFPDDVSAELLSSVLNLKQREDFIFLYKELLGPLANIGRHDLVRVIEDEITRYHFQESAWKVRFKKFDQCYLNCNLKKLASKMAVTRRSNNSAFRSKKNAF